MLLLNYSNVIDPLLRGVRKKILEVCDLKKQDYVIDVCCGSGDQAKYFSLKSDFVFGIDKDPGMIELAKRGKDPQFVLADATRAPFKDSHFDVATICLGLHEKDRGTREKVISEMKRIVKNNGLIVVADYNVPLPKSFYGALARLIERMAGQEHFSCFNDYLKQGGLDKLVGNRREERLRIYHGLIEIIKIRNKKI